MTVTTKQIIGSNFRVFQKLQTKSCLVHCKKYIAIAKKLKQKMRFNLKFLVDISFSVSTVMLHVSAISPFLYFQMAAKVIKDNLDVKFGPSWHAVVGEGFGFNISYECKTLLYLFFGGNIGICIWKCWSQFYVISYSSNIEKFFMPYSVVPTVCTYWINNSCI